MAATSTPSSRPFPPHTLEKALIIINAIVDKGASKPMDRLLVADAIGRTPSSSEFRRLLSSSRWYGLTLGTEKADNIVPTELGLKISKPTHLDEALQGKVQACLNVEIIDKLWRQFNRQKLPDAKFLKNTLERSYSLSAEHADEFSELAVANAKFCGILQDISGAKYIRMDEPKADAVPAAVLSDVSEDREAETAFEIVSEAEDEPLEAPVKATRGNRVFITHGKDKGILAQVKEIVAYGKFEPIIAQERETSAKPVPDKVMDDMRSCQAAVIHVGIDEIWFDKDGNEKPQINGNVLIEIGAAMALYGKNFVLLVEEGVILPSNLQGLYECRYKGDELSMTATMKLLKAFNDFT
ncbi:MAG: hypothetical protein B7Y86_01695 [Brevundimonas subvibrioides]|uniref:CD-NTase-associated protein 12/Pycsar effector protein TIR domain-containing protein n=1 Tax=Brevundimonas subvibrioides TaxID=74313 RepID=A0A258HQL1_9CAUL|nr:TIR domain-containing protein [Brevundimonas subvibrioides]OYX59156.1 MAG: hypothetical protein B7Y86_01695 [Brevundimonas subvibrioides]